MDFTQYTCPVCNEQFKNGEDIVVCPECGTPHHRECYEKNGKCFFEDKHSSGFSFEEVNPSSTTEKNNDSFEDFNQVVVCPVCFHKNAKGAEVCSRCGSKLDDSKTESAGQQNNPQNPNQNSNQNPNQNAMPPFEFGASGMPGFDPLAGLDGKEELGDGINAGETAKFTGKNTQYFSFVFYRLRQINKSKFSFAAFIFSGIYFLYRKMYGIGILFSLIQIATNVLSTYILLTPEWSSCVNGIADLSSAEIAGSPQNMGGYLLMTMFAYLPFLLSGVRYIIMLLSGLFANRWYYKHTMKKIKKIKDMNSEDSDDSLSKKLETGGGVNLPFAISFGIAMLIISYICNFFIMTSNIGL